MAAASTEISGISIQSQGMATAALSSPSNSPDNSSSNHNYYQVNDATAIMILVASCAFLVIGLAGYYLNKCFSPPATIPTTQQLQTADQLRPLQKKEGLAPEVIESFPIVAYSAASMAKHSTECAVCLAEFQEGEMTRSLPKCSHAFHPECIEEWLLSHSTCPLCRISLVSDDHTIHIDSTVDPQESVTQESFAHDTAAIAQEELRGPSETSTRLTDAVERIEEREGAVVALSLGSGSFQLAALEMENREMLEATSVYRSSSARWINRLRRSSSLERPRSQSSKLDVASGNLVETFSIKELTEKNNSSGFFSRSRSERISQNSIKAEQIT